jgi:uncharacterized protein
MHIWIYNPYMHGKVSRMLFSMLQRKLELVPVVAVLGPRQCGKSTLARMFTESLDHFVWLDLERPTDLRKLDDPETFFSENGNRLICIDEIQRKPELFAVLRYQVDKTDNPGQFLILGSASRDLIRQSSETLAGRISYLELTPFLLNEISSIGTLTQYHSRGGYPKSFLCETDRQSFEWRLDFIRDFIERDIPFFNPRLSVQTADRLLRMISHMHGQILNINTLAKALGIDSKTVKKYLELLEGAFVVRLLPPYFSNQKKRLVKSPKVYVRDTGILHALLQLGDWNSLAGHPIYGYSWESLCIENILANIKPEVRYSFYRTSNGAEIDLVLEKGEDRAAVEFKASSAPKVEHGYWLSLDDLGIDNGWIVAPVSEKYSSKGISVSSLTGFLSAKELRDFLL